jgi:hypothetical protein
VLALINIILSLFHVSEPMKHDTGLNADENEFLNDVASEIKSKYCRRGTLVAINLFLGLGKRRAEVSLPSKDHSESEGGSESDESDEGGEEEDDTEDNSGMGGQDKEDVRSISLNWHLLFLKAICSSSWLKTSQVSISRSDSAGKIVVAIKSDSPISSNANYRCLRSVAFGWQLVLLVCVLMRHYLLGPFSQKKWKC